MATVIAFASGYVFYMREIWWALIVVGLVGIVQISTKSSMNAQFREGLARGFPGSLALKAVSNNVAHLNMVSSLLVYVFGVFALVVYF